MLSLLRVHLCTLPASALLVACGHTVCHGCCTLMLQTLQPAPSADCSGKALECPVCRVETKVKGGQAGSLKNYLAFGC